jgi:hypothetical protein
MATMPKPVTIPLGAIRIYFIDFFTRRVPMILLSLALLAAGVILTIQQVEGWGLFLGIPLVLIGFTFTIITIDEIAREKLGPGNFQTLHCKICGKPTLASKGVREKICQACRGKIKEEAGKEKLSTSF